MTEQELNELADELEATHKEITMRLLATGEHSGAAIDSARIEATKSVLQRVATTTAKRTRKGTFTDAAFVADEFFDKLCDAEAKHEERGELDKAKMYEYQSWAALNIRDALFDKATAISEGEGK